MILDMNKSFASLPTFHFDSSDLFAVVETPEGSRNKANFNEHLEVFELKKVLPRFIFGFIPFTKGDDGDRMDVLLLLDDPVPMGCIIRVRAVGAIQAEQGGGRR